MSKRMTPEEVLSSVVEGINTGNMDSLMTLYEAGACFATQPGHLAKDAESIRQCLRNFIDLKGKLDLKVKRVLQASDLALVTVVRPDIGDIIAYRHGLHFYCCKEVNPYRNQK